MARTAGGYVRRSSQKATDHWGGIVDFYCHRAALVVEVDGDVHDLQQEEDVSREKALSELGPRTIRFRNDEVVRKLSAVVGKEQLT